MRETAIEAARAGGEIVARYFRRTIEVEYKGPKDIVTEADVASESRIVTLLHKRFPEHGIMAEERGGDLTSAEYTWVIDPLDGTHNYAAGIPICCVSVALAHFGEPIVGVIYDPLHDDIFVAEKGKGAFLNNEPMHVSTLPELDQALIIFGLGYDPDRAVSSLKIAAKLRPMVRTMRVLGSAALEMAYLAAGRFDLFYHQCLYPWDVAAGLLLIREAGGLCTDMHDQPVDLTTCGLVAANPQLHAEFMNRCVRATG
jgi:myo-inositol-1(or 4)-monophosphatase